MWAAWERVSFQERCLTLIPSFILCRREAPISIASTWSHEPGTNKTLNILIYRLCSNEKLISGSVAQACQAFGTLSLNNQWSLGHSFKLVKSHTISPLNGFKYLVFTYVSVIMGGKFHYVNYNFTRSSVFMCKATCRLYLHPIVAFGPLVTVECNFQIGHEVTVTVCLFTMIKLMMNVLNIYTKNKWPPYVW